MNPATVLVDVMWAAALWAGAITGGIVLSVIGGTVAVVKFIRAACRRWRVYRARTTAHTAAEGPDYRKAA